MEQPRIVPMFNLKRRKIDILKELEDAYIRQTSLLPAPFENKKVKVDMFFYPLQEISGDFYDVWWDEKTDTLHGYLIDATGHDICSALQVFALRELFRCSLSVIPSGSLSDRMQWINQQMWNDRFDPLQAAAILFSLKPDGTFCYTTAGISPVYTYINSKPIYLDMYGYLLGITPDADYSESCIQLGKGDSIIIMTDGFSERLEINPCRPKTTVKLMQKIGNDPARRDDASAIIVYQK